MHDMNTKVVSNIWANILGSTIYRPQIINGLIGWEHQQVLGWVK